MKRSKDFIVHKLGGKTVSECAQNRQESYKAGYDFAYTEMREYAKEINGLSSEEWCKAMWEFINK